MKKSKKEKARYNAGNMVNLSDEMFKAMYAQKDTEITFFGDTKTMEARAVKLGIATEKK